MTYQEFLDIPIGEKVFVYRYITREVDFYIKKDQFSIISDDGVNVVAIGPFIVDKLFKTEDNVINMLYKEQIKQFEHDISSSYNLIIEIKEDISSQKKKLKKLNEKFGYLKDKYPEEFI